MKSLLWVVLATASPDYSSFSNYLCSPRPRRAVASTVVAAHWKFSEEERKCCLMAGFGRSSLELGTWGAVGHGWPGDICPGTSITLWPLWLHEVYLLVTFTGLIKDPTSFQLLRIWGFVVFIFSLCVFVLFGLEAIPRTLIFPQTGNPVSLACCSCSPACLPHCCAFLSRTVVFIRKWKY